MTARSWIRLVVLLALVATLPTVECSLLSMKDAAAPSDNSHSNHADAAAAPISLGQHQVNQNVLFQVQVTIQMELEEDEETAHKGQQSLYYPSMTDSAVANATAKWLAESRNYILTLDELRGGSSSSNNDHQQQEKSTEMAAKTGLQMEQLLVIPWVLLLEPNNNKNFVFRGETTLSLLLPLLPAAAQGSTTTTTTMRTVVVSLWEENLLAHKNNNNNAVDTDGAPVLLTRRLANLPRMTTHQLSSNNRDSRGARGGSMMQPEDNPFVKVQLQVSSSFALPRSDDEYDSHRGNDYYSGTAWQSFMGGFAALVSSVWYWQVVVLNTKPENEDSHGEELEEGRDFEQDELVIGNPCNNNNDNNNNHEEDGILQEEEEEEEKERDNLSYEDDAYCSSDCENEDKIHRPPKLVRRKPPLFVPEDLTFMSRPEGTAASPSKRVLWENATEYESTTLQVVQDDKAAAAKSPPSIPEDVQVQDREKEEESVVAEFDCDNQSDSYSLNDHGQEHVLDEKNDFQEEKLPPAEDGGETTSRLKTAEDEELGVTLEEPRDGKTEETPQGGPALEEGKPFNKDPTVSLVASLPLSNLGEDRTTENDNSESSPAAATTTATGEQHSMTAKANSPQVAAIYDDSNCSTVSVKDTVPLKNSRAPSAKGTNTRDDSSNIGIGIASSRRTEEQAEQGDDDNWLRRLRNRGGDRTITKDDAATHPQMDPPSLPGKLSKRQHDVSPGISYVSTLPPHSDSSRDRPDLGLPKPRDEKIPFALDAPAGTIQPLPKPTRNRRRRISTKLPSEENGNKTSGATIEEPPKSSRERNNSRPKRSLAKVEPEVISLLSSSPASTNEQVKEGGAETSRKRPISVLNEREDGKRASSRSVGAASDSRKARRKRRRRSSNIELLPPDVVPSIALTSAAQMVEKPVWQVSRKQSIPKCVTVKSVK